MNNVLLSNEVIILQSVGFLVLVMQALASVFGLYIYKKWDFSSTSSFQYSLEKKAYLIVLILFFSLLAKIILLPYFAFTIDSLSEIVHGAMCAAGVVNANEFGYFLLSLKLFIIFIVGAWLIINKLDILAINYPYMKTKLIFASVIFLFVLFEFIIEILYFTHISTDIPVQCCSVIYGVTGNSDPLPFGMDMLTLLIVFYSSFLLVIVANIQKNALFSFISGGLFLYFGYYGVTYFFGTYVYQLPTHICPFCMLKKEYNFIGYAIWGSLFLGSFFSMVNLLLKSLINVAINRYFLFSTLFNTVFVIICTSYVVVYYLINGVLL
ncbi:hypothetical protein [Arcobacter sp. FWKO B]|uniref:hypothetical protein n=1 Tax=Arcobacter sp. FWKO B TaxID=2593672 RepID=UPI0018A69A86|nr:hypothetical protein [Arcobacter sp. FWKO B]QOG11862.1 hypothetical protein FWKOB_03730 [Arcobacter sp. FWKO B]